MKRPTPPVTRVWPLLESNNAISIEATHILPHDPTTH